MANSSKTLPNFCNRCQNYYDTPHCDCYTKTNPNKQEMKLYMVTVNVTSKKKDKFPPTKGYRTYILDIDPVDAESRVVALIGRDRVNAMIPPTVEEVPGPFSKGQVLFWDEF